MDPAKSPLERGDFLVRNLVGVDQSSGAIAVSEPVKVGQTIQFQIRDAQSAREDLHVLLQGMAKRLGSRRPAFGCYFNCAGRGQGLFGVPDHDVTLIREHVGKFPLVGFLAMASSRLSAAGTFSPPTPARCWSFPRTRPEPILKPVVRVSLERLRSDDENTLQRVA